MRPKWFTVLALGLVSMMTLAATQPDCSFLKNPDEFAVKDRLTLNKARSGSTIHVASGIYADRVSASSATLDPSTIKHNNFIDDYIFNRMALAGIQSAPLTSDAEFLRRVSLDLTGRIPAANVISDFLADPDPSKRDRKINELVGTPEFIDKWTMFFGDLLRINIQTSAINRAVPGRDAFYLYVKDAMTNNKPYDQMARELIADSGDTFVQGETNWPLGNTVAMGPAQDTYDGQAVNLAGMFLGINSVDCLLCHNGARHLDTVNLWGSTQLRQNMWGLSAYFARVRMTRTVVDTTTNLAKYVISEATTGEYQLNTTTGNRVSRQPISGVTVAAPHNPFSTVTGSGVANGENRRDAIARQVTGDIQFSRAIVNYVWEKIMVEAFVSPSNAFDLARLDPNNPPPAPWTLQPTNPQLLDALAHWFQQNHYDLRALIGLIVKANAYQLSSTYPGNWDVSYVPYYARKYPRRLDAEEIHDATVQAAGVVPTYTITGSTLPAVHWAMQFPDSSEPRSNGTVVQFLNSFGRGDRTATFRRSDTSVLQSLNMMNNTVITSRIHQTNAGSRVQAILAQSSIPGVIINQLFMNTLSRPPSNDEANYFTGAFQLQGNRAAAENLQWVLLNKMDFLFNY